MNRGTKLIPRVSTALLTLGAAACGDGGDDAATPRSVAKDMCEHGLECNDYFSDYYDSLADCVAQITGEIEYYLDYYTEVYGAACANALLNYYGCVAALEAVSCEPSRASCADEEATLYEACDFSSYY